MAEHDFDIKLPWRCYRLYEIILTFSAFIERSFITLPQLQSLPPIPFHKQLMLSDDLIEHLKLWRGRWRIYRRVCGFCSFLFYSFCPIDSKSDRQLAIPDTRLKRKFHENERHLSSCSLLAYSAARVLSD